MLAFFDTSIHIDLLRGTRPLAQVLEAAGNPPVRLDPNIYYQNVGTFIGSAGVMFPSASGGYDVSYPLARTINASLGIQHQVGFG